MRERVREGGGLGKEVPWVTYGIGSRGCKIDGRCIIYYYVGG